MYIHAKSEKVLAQLSFCARTQHVAVKNEQERVKTSPTWTGAGAFDLLACVADAVGAAVERRRRRALALPTLLAPTAAAAALAPRRPRRPPSVN
jgi:hypothetical protein